MSAVKAFTSANVVVNGFANNPADSFSISVPYKVFASDGGDDNAPRSFEDTAYVLIPLGSTATEVYAAVMADIATKCVAFDFPVPDKDDIFGFAPMPFSALLPDLPTVS